MRKKEESPRQMWDIIKTTKIYVMQVQEDEERKKMKKIFKEIKV